MIENIYLDSSEDSLLTIGCSVIDAVRVLSGAALLRRNVNP